MPLYEYECDACGGRFEVIQKFSETTEQCRKCGKGPVRRLMSSPAIQFKGSGFYITDYAQKGKSGSESSGEGGSSGKKEEATKKDEAPKSDTAAKSDSSASTSASTPSSTSSSKD
jgi:putative FmdB family regulatory protein